MESSEELLRYRSVDIVEYMNQKYNKIDLVEIEAERNALKGLLKRENENKLQYFLQRQDPLLRLLETYQQCHDVINNFIISQKSEFDFKEEVNLSSMELKKSFALFKDNMTLFLTTDRYFITSVTFDDGNILCVLSNDILFIGEKDGQMFKLKRSVSKEAMRMEIKEETTLNILLDGSICELKGTKKNVEELFDAFQEISYRVVKEENEEEEEIDEDLIEFYIQTERYDEIIAYIGKIKNKKRILSIFDKIAIPDKETLLKVKDEELINHFFFERFKAGLDKINKIQPLKRYICKVFQYIEVFADEYYKNSKECLISKRSFILSMESCVQYTLKRIEPRVISHHKICDENLFEMVQEKLEFPKLNFKYLIKNVKIEKPIDRSLIDNVKDKIKEEVHNFIK